VASKARVTAQEKQQRLDQLLLLLAQGHSTSQVVKACMQAWGLCERQAFRYHAEAVAMQRCLAEGDVLDHQGRLLARVQHICQRGFKEGDLNLALRATATELSILKLNGGNSHDSAPAATPAASGELLAALQQPQTKRRTRKPDNPA
jgi:hypothetical protein